MRTATVALLRVWFTGAALTLLALAGCSKHASTGASGNAAPPSGPPPGSTLAIAGQMFTGEDPSAIRSYLQTVKDIKPTKFEVEWNPATVAVSKDEAIRSLRSISQDGSTFRLLSSEPVVAKLKPGSILWIYDIAVRKVERVEIEDDVTVLYTQSIPLTEAMTNAHIEYDAPVSLADYYIGHRPPPAPVAPPPTTRVVRPWKFIPVALDPAPAPAPPDQNPGDTPPADNSNPDLEEAGIPPHGGHTGTIKGFDYSLGYTTRSDGVSLTLEAK